MRTFFPKSRLLAIAALLIAVAVAVAACDTSPTPAPATPTDDTSQAATPMASPTGESMPLMLELPRDFPIETYPGGEYAAGTELNFSEFFTDGKPVILNFWAGLCPPCRAEMPDFQEFDEQNRDRVTLVGVDIGQHLGLGNREDAAALLEELGITYPTGLTSDDTVTRPYKVLGMPTTVFPQPGRDGLPDLERHPHQGAAERQGGRAADGTIDEPAPQTVSAAPNKNPSRG